MSSPGPAVERDLHSFLYPRSVAVIGASADPAKPSGRSVLNLIQSRYAGDVFPVNPKQQQMYGLPCYPSLADIPGEVGLALIFLPNTGVLDAVRECAAEGVRNIIVFSSGFSEIGETGRKYQAELKQLAVTHGLNVLGPNCAGLFDVTNRTAFNFSPYFEPETWRPGPIGVVVQGGGLGRAMWEGDEKGPGLSWVISAGNEADLEVSDFIRYMADDDSTRVIVAVIEAVKDGDKFRQAVRHAKSRGKVVLALKTGRSELGQRAVALHTGVLAGASKSYDAVFDELGVVQAADIDELYYLAALYSRFEPVPGSGLAVITYSGGAGALTADIAGTHGLTLPAPEGATRDFLESLTVSYGNVANPLDLTTEVYKRPAMVTDAVRAFLDDDRYGVVLVPIAYYYPVLVEGVCLEIIKAARQSDKPLAVLWLSQGPSKPAKDLLEKAGVPVFRSIERCMSVFKKFLTDLPVRTETPAEWQAKDLLGAGRFPHQVLQEHVVKPMLATYGMRVPQERLVHDETEAVKAWRDIGGPCALKVMSSDIVHKNHVGGVVLGVDSAEEMTEKYASMIASVATAAPEAKVDGVLVQELVQGFELIMGIQNDPVWGPMVMVGLGGIYAELLEDVVVHSAPLTHDAALDMVRAMKGHKILQARGGGNDDDVADALVTLGQFAVDHRAYLRGMDLNPVLVTERAGAVVVDAVALLADERVV